MSSNASENTSKKILDGSLSLGATVSFSQLSLKNSCKNEILTAALKNQNLTSESTLSRDEAKFILHWSKAFCSSKWDLFLAAWCRALQSYGTELSFIDGLRYVDVNFKIAGQKYSGVVAKGGRFSERTRLTRNQPPYQPHHGSEAYNFAHQRSCPLCQNILYAIDSTRNPSLGQTNVLLDIGDYVFMPNKYPAQPGSALLVPKNHDNHSLRSAQRIDSNGQRRIAVEPGKTRGKITERSDLVTLTALCDAFDMVATKNHVLNVMTIPEHDHFHLTPKASPIFGMFDTVGSEIGLRGTSDRLFTPQATPFATLAIHDNNRDSLIESALAVLSGLEQDNNVFTYAYYNNIFLINVNDRSVIDDCIEGPCAGAGVPLHHIDVEIPGMLESVLRISPLKDSFDWSPYLPKT